MQVSHRYATNTTCDNLLDLALLQMLHIDVNAIYHHKQASSVLQI